MAQLSKDRIELLKQEFEINAVLSSKPGGQSANRNYTKIELRFDIENSQVLSEKEKNKLLKKLSGKISNENIYIVTSQEERSQLQNKENAIEKIIKDLQAALKPVKKRKATKVPKKQKEKRLKNKKIQSEKKVRRKKPDL